jgi:hypothetical protein
MILTELKDKINQLTEKKDFEQALNALLEDYFSLKIFYIHQEILRYEYKWNMTYSDFEKKSVDLSNGFTYEIEKEYYDWGEKVALLEYYQKFKSEWI